MSRTIEEIKADIEVRQHDLSSLYEKFNARFPLHEKEIAELKDELRLVIEHESVKRNTAICGIPLDRLEAICQAERDGRCIILPCKVGDTVWVLSDGEAVECVMDDAMRFKAVKYNLEIMRHFNGKIGEQQTVFLTRESAEAALRKEQEQ